MASPRICSVKGCGKIAKTRGWCAGHYWRWQQHGDPATGKAPRSAGLHFIKKVALAFHGGECLLWPYGKTRNGYGAVYVGSRQRGAHVVTCELAHGPSPHPGFEVAHSCGNSACCNPAHLRWDSRAGNHADKLRHGTHNRGERHNRAKLTEADVREIRALRSQCSQRSIAKRFGVCQATVREILHGQIWSWLK